MGLSSPSPVPESSGELLDQLLGSLLGDFNSWFERGLVLLDHCPESVMPLDQQQALRQRLEQARKELSAASSLRQAAPWHQLVLTVWNLSASLRVSGVSLPAHPGADGPGLDGPGADHL